MNEEQAQQGMETKMPSKRETKTTEERKRNTMKTTSNLNRLYCVMLS